MIAVLVKGQGAVGGFLLDEALNDRPLIFNGHIFLAQLIIRRNTGITGSLNRFNPYFYHTYFRLQTTLYLFLSQIATGNAH